MGRMKEETLLVKKISGTVDGRYARIDGDLFPLVSNVWVDGGIYTNPFAAPLHDVSNPKDREFLVVLLQKHRVVLTDDKTKRPTDDIVGSQPHGNPLGLYAIDSPTYDPASGLRFTLGPLIAHLEP